MSRRIERGPIGNNPLKRGNDKYNHLKEAAEIITGTDELPGMQLYFQSDPELSEKLKEAGRQSRNIANLARELRDNPDGLGRLLVKTKWHLKTSIK